MKLIANIFVIFVLNSKLAYANVSSIEDVCLATIKDVLVLEDKRLKAVALKASAKEYQFILDKLTKRAKIYHYLECSRHDK